MKYESGDGMRQNTIDTTELTRRIQAGSQVAETEFVETFSNSILLLLINKTQNHDIAKDCCQQALLITLIKIRDGGIAKPESLLSFLRHTATNVANTHFRKERRYTSLNEEFLSAPVRNGDNAAQDRDCKTIRLILNDTLDLLSVERDREILTRFYLRDEDKSIIRGDMEISAAHFDRVLYRAKSRLRDVLDCREELKALFIQSLGNCRRVSH